MEFHFVTLDAFLIIVMEVRLVLNLQSLPAFASQSLRLQACTITSGLFSPSLCICACGYINLCFSIWRPEVNVGCHFLSFSTFFFETQGLFLYMKLTYWLYWLMSKPLGFFCLWMPVLGLEVYVAVIGFYVGARDPNSGSCACIASTLPSKPPSYPAMLH